MSLLTLANIHLAFAAKNGPRQQLLNFVTARKGRSGIVYAGSRNILVLGIIGMSSAAAAPGAGSLLAGAGNKQGARVISTRERRAGTVAQRIGSKLRLHRVFVKKPKAILP